MSIDEKDVIVKIYELRDPRIVDDSYAKSTKYIGCTTKSLEKRLNDHLYDIKYNRTKNLHKSRWIKSLLDSGLKPTIHLIEEVIGLEYGFNVEIYWIQEFKEYGCKLTNVADGGRTGPSALSGKLISNSLKRYYENKKPVCSRSRKVYQFKLDGTFLAEFESITQAHKITGVHRQSIHLNATGKYSQAEGYLWSFTNPPNNLIDNPRHMLGVLQFDKKGVFIKHWKIVNEASRKLKIQPANILAVAKGLPHRLTAGGFVWKFKEH